ncbi:MAG TPA: ribosome assembly cofactor RimP [Salinivirgaceae bacterium]|nr:ribosome assembly cofactor RimP [Salinivirgaceae bacterium]
MVTSAQIDSIVKESITGTEIFVVEIIISSGNNIVVRLDHPDGLLIDTCAYISRQIEAALDRDLEDYSLEVTSAGIGEPFKIKRQYEKVIGKKIELVLKNGSKIVETLHSVDDIGITVSQSKTKYSKSALKKMPKEERKIVENEQNKPIKLTWEEIKSATEHIVF